MIKNQEKTAHIISRYKSTEKYTKGRTNTRFSVLDSKKRTVKTVMFVTSSSYTTEEDYNILERKAINSYIKSKD